MLPLPPADIASRHLDYSTRFLIRHFHISGWPLSEFSLPIATLSFAAIFSFAILLFFSPAFQLAAFHMAFFDSFRH